MSISIRPWYFLIIVLIVLTYCALNIPLLSSIFGFGTKLTSINSPAAKRFKVFEKGIKASPRMNASKYGSMCHTPECVAFYESAYYNSDPRIPTVRHILWKSDRVSTYFARQLKTWQAIHPNWTYMLWQDSDMEKFVAKHYTGALQKFRGLKRHIMRIDMIRYLILHHFGGVYADLDYVLLRPLDRFIKFPAVVTRETEAHSFLHYGMVAYPPKVLGNPAFMMSEPGHPFFHYSLMQFNVRGAEETFNFAGPLALSDLLLEYAALFPLSENPDGVVIVPASRNFYGFGNNNLASSGSSYKGGIVQNLNDKCNGVKKLPNAAKELLEYCKDVSNLNPITDPNELEYALHDYNKSRSSHDAADLPIFADNKIDIRSILRNMVIASTVF